MRHAGDGPVVWIVDADHWSRACIRAELIERGLDAIGVPTLGTAVLAYLRGRVQRPRVLFLDLRHLGLSPDDLDRLAVLKLPVVALGGAAELEAPPVKGFPWAAVLRRPVTIGQIADAMEAAARGQEEDGLRPAR